MLLDGTSRERPIHPSFIVSLDGTEDLLNGTEGNLKPYMRLISMYIFGAFVFSFETHNKRNFGIKIHNIRSIPPRLKTC